MNIELENLVLRYVEAREAVRSVFRMESEYSFPVAAELFAAENVPVDSDRLTACKRLIKDRTGIFSNFRGSVEVPLAAKLALSDDPNRRMERAVQNYGILKEHFLRSEFLALAALLLTDSVPDADVSAIAARGKALYRRMKAEHPVLTGQEDAVFAILLAESEKSDDALIADAEACYRVLDARFMKGDGIQTASHVLALTDGDPVKSAEKTVALYDAIRAAGGKYGSNWELSGLAALAADDTPTDTIVSELMEIDALLEGQDGYRGLFGYDRKTRMMHAAMLLGAHRMRGRKEIVTAAAQQSAISMIAAQQAAMCACIACCSAASSASTAH